MDGAGDFVASNRNFAHFSIHFQFSFLKDPLALSNPMVNTIGLQGIARKIDSYTNCDAFLTDIDTLVHIYSLAFDSKL